MKNLYSGSAPRKSSRNFIKTALLVACIALASPARAGDLETAVALFTQGKADMDAGKYRSACPALAESYRLVPKPGTLFILAFCESKWGRFATADARLEEYLRLYDTLAPDQQKLQKDYDRPRLAAKERTRLKPDIPMLTLTLGPNIPPDTVVKRNAQVVEANKLGVAVPVDPGEYVVSIQVPGASPKEQSITLAKGEQKSILLEVEAPKAGPIQGMIIAPPLIQAEPITGSNSLRPAAFITGGIGLSGILLGAIFGGIAAGKASDQKANCGEAIGKSDPAVCNKTGFDAAQSLTPLATASTISFIAGGIGLATGVTLYILSPSSPELQNPKNPQNPKSGASPSIRAGILSTTPTSILLGSQGSF